jgi:type IV pilus assembly protein PilC
MLTFSYKGRDSSGQIVSATIEAPSKQEALRQLQRDGLFVTDIKLGSSPIDTEDLLTRHAARQVGREEVIGFASQLSIMLETGVPIAEALGALKSQAKTSDFKRVLTVISDRVTAGVNFSDAVEEFPKVFPPLMISLIRASEASGTMGTMLGRIADYLSKERKTIRQIKGALTYPMIMVSLAIVVTSFLVVWVLPRFATIYESRSAALPAPTQIILSCSNFITAHWVAIIASMVALTVTAILVRMTSFGRRVIDTFKVRAPVIGPMFKHFYLTRATRTLGTLIASGVTLLDAVRIVRGVTANVLWTGLWEDMESSMTQGKTVASVILESELIPPTTAQMIAAGERGGRLPEVLERVAAATEEDLDVAIKNGTQLIEPAMILFMGLTVGGIAIALLLPIFSVANVMSG